MNHLLSAALRPWEAFPLREESWPRALARMAALRIPLAFLQWLLAWRALRLLRADFVSMKGPLWPHILQRLPPEVSLVDLQDLLMRIPNPAPLAAVWPWLALGSILGVLGAWAHHAVWDHGSFWILGGLSRPGPGFRGTLAAEAQALEVGAAGAALGLLQYLPGVGIWLGMPLGILGMWFWILRGFALARIHQAPLWKGVGATVLHACCAGLCALGLMFLLLAQWTAMMAAP